MEEGNYYLLGMKKSFDCTDTDRECSVLLCVAGKMFVCLKSVLNSPSQSFVARCCSMEMDRARWNRLVVKLGTKVCAPIAQVYSS